MHLEYITVWNDQCFRSIPTIVACSNASSHYYMKLCRFEKHDITTTIQFIGDTRNSDKSEQGTIHLAWKPCKYFLGVNANSHITAKVSSSLDSDDDSSLSSVAKES